MRPLADAILTTVLWCCEVVALPAAAAYAVLDHAMQDARVRSRLTRCDGGWWLALRRIWSARLSRECLNTAMRIGLAEAVSRRVALADGQVPPSGCVLAICHSPWGRALALWNAAHPLALVKAAARWKSRGRAAYVGSGIAALRELHGRLRGGARVAVVIDCFDADDGPALAFLGIPVRVGGGAARLARAAGVPIVPTRASLERGHIRVSFGPPIDATSLGVDESMRQVMRAFEATVRADPAAWDHLLPFARGAAPATAPSTVRQRARARERTDALRQPGRGDHDRQRARDA